MPLPVIDAALCDGCKACVEICPVTVYAMLGDKAIVVAAEDCTACQACIPACHADCIVVNDD